MIIVDAICILIGVCGAVWVSYAWSETSRFRKLEREHDELTIDYLDLKALCLSTDEAVVEVADTHIDVVRKCGKHKVVLKRYDNPVANPKPNLNHTRAKFLAATINTTIYAN
jgi:hypothetical protein